MKYVIETITKHLENLDRDIVQQNELIQSRQKQLAECVGKLDVLTETRRQFAEALDTLQPAFPKSSVFSDVDKGWKDLLSYPKTETEQPPNPFEPNAKKTKRDDQP